METVKLSKEYVFEDFEPVTELNLDLDNLKGSDILEVSDLLQSQGHVSVQTSLDNKVHAAWLLAVIGRPIEYLKWITSERLLLKFVKKYRIFGSRSFDEQKPIDKANKLETSPNKVN